ncbi:hypothetical protein J3F84DRAFT_349407 [Trichoderma pleuroticola]
MTLVMNWGSLIPSMAATNALYDGNSQPLLGNTTTHNYFGEPPTMKDLRIHTSEAAINHGVYSLDGAENSDLDVAGCLMMNAPMVSFGFTTGNDYKIADDAVEEPALYVDIESDEESPGVQDNDIGEILNINGLVGSVQPVVLRISPCLAKFGLDGEWSKSA